MANTFIFEDDEQPQSNMEVPEEEPTEEEGQEEGESGNRTFMIIAIVLGVVILLTMICGAGVVFFWLPRSNASATQTQAVMSASGTEAALIEMQTATAGAATETPLPSEIPATLEPSATPLILFASDSPTPEAGSTVDPATATVQALETQLASVNLTTTAQANSVTATPGKGTPSATNALSKTGFADEVGLPGLFIVSIILVAVILLARRLRQAPLAR
jgi:cytoskeletal protein RodZ